MVTKRFQDSGFSEAFNKSMQIQLPDPEYRDWPVFILRSIYLVFPTLSASIGASYAAGLNIWWTLLFALIAAGPTFLGTLLGFMTDSRKPQTKTRRGDVTGLGK